MFRLHSVYGEWLKVPSNANGGLARLHENSDFSYLKLADVILLSSMLHELVNGRSNCPDILHRITFKLPSSHGGASGLLARRYYRTI